MRMRILAWNLDLISVWQQEKLILLCCSNEPASVCCLIQCPPGNNFVIRSISTCAKMDGQTGLSLLCSFHYDFLWASWAAQPHAHDAENQNQVWRNLILHPVWFFCRFTDKWRNTTASRCLPLMLISHITPSCFLWHQKIVAPSHSPFQNFNRYCVDRSWIERKWFRNAKTLKLERPITSVKLFIGQIGR